MEEDVSLIKIELKEFKGETLEAVFDYLTYKVIISYTLI